MRTGAFDHGGETFLLHVHIVPAGSAELAELVDFRDRLRAEPALVREYAAAKRALIDAGIRDGADYAQAKGQFIVGLGTREASDH